MKSSSRSLISNLSGRRITWLPAAALSLLLQGLPSTVSAVPCSYGENFDFPTFTAGAASVTGSMANLDIDRMPATVTVTNGNGGNLPASIAGAQTGVGEGYASYSPALAHVNSPPYGRGLQITGTADTPLIYTFSKPMRNLVMHIRSGDNKIYTFTDGAGNPVEFTYHFVPKLGAVPQTGNGASSEYFLQTAPNQLAVGEIATGSIAFKTPVTVLRVAQSYIANTRPDLTPANLNTTSSVYMVNFGQYCDQPGVLDYCNDLKPAQWETSSYSSTVNPDTFSGRILDETGKAVSVTFTGGLRQAAALGVTNDFPNYPACDIIATVDATTGTDPVTLTWTFGEEVKNPSLLLRGDAGVVPYFYKFYKADGVTPLPFLLRKTGSPDDARQVDGNTLYAPRTSFDIVQFVENTTAIVMKVRRESATGSVNIGGNYTVFMGCNGTLTPAGSAINADIDNDGVPDLTDKCPNTPAGAVVGADGCPLPTDLSITKSASVSKITPGVPFNYTITVTNTGAQATNVKASDLVPAGLTINSVTASDAGVVTQNGQSVEAVWAIVPDGATRALTINVTKP